MPIAIAGWRRYVNRSCYEPPSRLSDCLTCQLQTLIFLRSPAELENCHAFSAGSWSVDPIPSFVGFILELPLFQVKVLMHHLVRSSHCKNISAFRTIIRACM
ncbi:hypothetical protein HRbin36_02575 [bacterium HR36]|nr:hypothetical protein HRbin36_02575 [bacterium HR36]